MYKVLIGWYVSGTFNRISQAQRFVNTNGGVIYKKVVYDQP